MMRKKWVLIGGCILVGLLIVFYIIGANIPPASTAVLPPDVRLQMTMALEDQMGLEDVIIAPVNDVLEVRMRAPTISGDALFAGVAQIFSYLDATAPEGFTALRLVFDIHNLDAGIIEVLRRDIADWKSGRVSNADFLAKKMHRVSLLK